MAEASSERPAQTGGAELTWDWSPAGSDLVLFLT